MADRVEIRVNGVVVSEFDTPAGAIQVIKYDDANPSGGVMAAFNLDGDGQGGAVGDPPPVDPPPVDPLPVDPPPVDPPVVPPVIPPVVTSPWAHPTTMDGMNALILDALARPKMVIMDPSVNFDLSHTLAFDIPEGGGQHFGVDWNYSRVNWVGPAGLGDNFFEFTLQAGQNRGFNWRHGYFFGGYPTPSFGFGIRIFAKPGTNMMYATVEDCVFEFCGGADLAGNLFESKVLACEGNGLSRGLVRTRHEGAVMSNITITVPHVHGSNFDPGLDLGDVSSVMIHGGSFIDCHGPGGAINADIGIKYLDGADFENCGGADNGAAIRMAQWVFGGSIRGCNFSNTMGQMPFGIAYPGVLDPNHVLTDFSVYQCEAIKR